MSFRRSSTSSFAGWTRQLSEVGLSLRMTEAARARLAEEGFEPAYGARPLKRVIQQRLANPLANALLGGRMQEGDVVEIDHDGSDFTFHSVHGSRPTVGEEGGVRRPAPTRRSVRRAGSGDPAQHVRRLIGDTSLAAA